MSDSKTISKKALTKPDILLKPLEDATSKSLSTSSTSNSLPTAQQSSSAKALLTVSAAAALSAIGIFALTQHPFIAATFAVFSLFALGAQQLIRKSLRLSTAQNESLQNTTLSQIEHVKRQMGQCKYLEFTEIEGTRSALLADGLLHQYKALQKILSEKLNPREITYSRYMNSIDSMSLSISETLIHCKSILENLEHQLKSGQTDSLEQKKQVTEHLDAVETALKQLAALFISINQMITKESYRDQLESQLQEIQVLADRAKIYSKQQ